MSTKKGCPEWTWESPSNLNVLYKSFHVRRNMSRFWSFPLISFRPNLAVSPLTNGLTPHEVQRQWGGELSFHRSSGPSLLTEPFLSPQAGRGVQSPPRGPLAPGIHTFHALCAAVLSQHSSKQSARWGCGLLPASHLTPKLWFLVTGHIKKAKKKKAKFMGFQRISQSSLSHLPYGQQYMRQAWCSVNPAEHTQGSCEYGIWDGKDSFEQTSHFRSNGKQKSHLFGFSPLTVWKSMHCIFPLHRGCPQCVITHDISTAVSVKVCLCRSSLHHQPSEWMKLKQIACCVFSKFISVQFIRYNLPLLCLSHLIKSIFGVHRFFSCSSH